MKTELITSIFNELLDECTRATVNDDLLIEIVFEDMLPFETPLIEKLASTTDKETAAAAAATTPTAAAVAVAVAVEPMDTSMVKVDAAKARRAKMATTNEKRMPPRVSKLNEAQEGKSILVYSIENSSMMLLLLCLSQ